MKIKKLLLTTALTATILPTGVTFAEGVNDKSDQTSAVEQVLSEVKTLEGQEREEILNKIIEVSLNDRRQTIHSYITGDIDFLSKKVAIEADVDTKFDLTDEDNPLFKILTNYTFHLEGEDSVESAANVYLTDDYLFIEKDGEAFKVSLEDQADFDEQLDMVKNVNDLTRDAITIQDDGENYIVSIDPTKLDPEEIVNASFDEEEMADLYVNASFDEEEMADLYDDMLERSEIDKDELSITKEDYIRITREKTVKALDLVLESLESNVSIYDKKTHQLISSEVAFNLNSEKLKELLDGVPFINADDLNVQLLIQTEVVDRNPELTKDDFPNPEEAKELSEEIEQSLDSQQDVEQDSEQDDDVDEDQDDNN